MSPDGKLTIRGYVLDTIEKMTIASLSDAGDENADHPASWLTLIHPYI